MKVFKAKDRFGSETEFILKEAGVKEVTEADMIYRIAYSNSLKNGILPREKMKDLMREHGIWDEEDDKALQELIKDIAKLELQLKESESRSDNAKCIELAELLDQARNKMWRLFLIQQNSYTNSCEGYADTVKQEALMASCVLIKANNARYWKNYKEYVLEKDENETSEVPMRAMETLAALLNTNKDTLLETFPEHRWLKEAKKQFFDKEIAKAEAELKERTENGKADIGDPVHTPGADNEIVPVQSVE